MPKFQNLKNIFRFDNPFQLLLNRVFFGNTGPTIYRRGNLQFLVDHNAGDQDGPRACVIPGLYDPFLDVIDLNEPVTFLDLGANAGGFVLALLNKECQINKGIAVELNPVTWSRLVYNIYSNVPDAAGKIKIINGAVASTDGFLDVRLGAGSVADNISGSETGTLYHLKCYSLSALIEQFGEKKIDLLKIDIEGSEYGLLNSPQSCLNGVRYLLIEIHEIPNRRPSEIHDWIHSCGFVSVEPSRKPIESNVYLYENQRHMGTKL